MLDIYIFVFQTLIIFFQTGQVEYESINAGITTGIVLAIILPMLACVGGVAFCFFKKRKESSTNWEFTIPRSRSNSRAKINDPALYSPEFSPNESPNRVMSPVSDTSSTASNSKMKRNYEKSYRTNEPLPGKPDVEWEEKDWDISPDGSDTGKNSPEKFPVKDEFVDPDYIYIEEPSMSRTGTMDSGLGYDKDHRPYTMYDPIEKEENNLQTSDSKSQPALNYGKEDYATIKGKNKHVPIVYSSKSTAV